MFGIAAVTGTVQLTTLLTVFASALPVPMADQVSVSGSRTAVWVELRSPSMKRPSGRTAFVASPICDQPGPESDVHAFVAGS